MRCAWVTDIHLNFVSAPERARFYRSIAAAAPDVLLAGGDIGEAGSVCDFLTEVEDALEVPIYFVLGNHDFYRGSIAGTRLAVSRHAAASPLLHWLPACGVVSLTPTVALVGHGGWADGRAGDYFGSDVFLNDFLLIEELRDRNALELFRTLNQLGDEAAEYLERVTGAALRNHDEVIVVTHVPPFPEACWHEGRISGPEFLPHFVCEAVGQRLLALAREYPGKQITVLCGHTHSSGKARLLENLTVFTGAAEYGLPVVQPGWPG